MDRWAWTHLDPWLELRGQLPAGRLFCVLRSPTCGRPYAAAGIRAQLHHAAATAGVRRRFAPHQLRHAHVVEMSRARASRCSSSKGSSGTPTWPSRPDTYAASTTPRSSPPSINDRHRWSPPTRGSPHAADAHARADARGRASARSHSAAETARKPTSTPRDSQGAPSRRRHRGGSQCLRGQVIVSRVDVCAVVVVHTVPTAPSHGGWPVNPTSALAGNAHAKAGPAIVGGPGERARLSARVRGLLVRRGGVCRGEEPPRDESGLRAHGSNQRFHRLLGHAVARALTTAPSLAGLGPAAPRILGSSTLSMGSVRSGWLPAGLLILDDGSPDASARRSSVPGRAGSD